MLAIKFPVSQPLPLPGQRLNMRKKDKADQTRQRDDKAVDMEKQNPWLA
jgi:hypothetical protein